jgi:hypothetical protein
MTREDFRRELGDAFDAISGSPDPALSNRVRSALVEAPERRGPVWIGALAAAVIAVILVGVLLLGNPLNRGPLVSGGPGTPTATPTPAASPSPTPVPSPMPSPTGSPASICSASAITANQAPLAVFIDAVRTGTHAGYDRMTFEFQNGQPPTIELRPQTGTTFTRDGVGDTVKLAGKNGILVIIRGADAHTAYSGPTDIKAGYAGLREARQVGDFEGVVQWGLGVSSTPCYHAYILNNPTRLVIDIPTS